MISPPTTVLPALEQLLAKRERRVAEAIRSVVGNVRPCIRLNTERASSVPIRGRLVDRWLGRARHKSVLPQTASKFGGMPYFENAAEITGARFLGQINFAETARDLANQGFPRPAGMPERGLLAFDLLDGVPGRTRWYPSPEPRESPMFDAEVVAKYEAAIRFQGTWSLRGLDWFDAVPEGDGELWEYMNDLEIPGVDLDGAWGHKLFGHANEALNEHYGFTPAPGRSDSIRDYDLLWRIDYDNAAGFSWGTNWIYVVIHRDDLARGALEHAIVTGANA